ncbi:MAG: alpha/beta fold hydrolase, partial [Deltaproteobacteria bacterium]
MDEPTTVSGSPAPGAPEVTVAVERRRVDCGEVSLDVHLAGPEDAPLVVMLHGFPESWWSWRHQIAALATRFRVAAPTLRGYGASERPDGVNAYRMDRLVGDVLGLVILTVVVRMVSEGSVSILDVAVIVLVAVGF